MSNESSGLKPIGTLYYEYFSTGIRANKYGTDCDDVRRYRVKIEVVNHGLDQAGKLCNIIREVETEYLD